MNNSKKLDQIIQRMEHYLECWKQFNHYVGLARSKQFGPEDEEQFLEIKSLLTQELEMIYASLEGATMPAREEVHTLVGSAPSVRSMSELSEAALKTLESQWHRLFISWESLLGQLKAKQKEEASQPKWSLFGGKK